MSTAIAAPQDQGAQRRSLIAEMAEHYGLEPASFFKTIKETIFSSKGSEAEMIAFLLVAKRYKLDPFTKEIYAFPKKEGGVQPVVSVDGWLSIINNHPDMDGIEFVDHLDDKGDLISVTCRIYRKSRSKPTECTEYMKECKRNTSTWSQWPRRMLRHKATIQCGRLAFSISGIVDPDEAERADSVAPINGNGSRIARSELNDVLAAQRKHDEQRFDAGSQPVSDEHDGIDPAPPSDESQATPDPEAAPFPADITDGFSRCVTIDNVNAMLDWANNNFQEHGERSSELAEEARQRIHKAQKPAKGAKAEQKSLVS